MSDAVLVGILAVIGEIVVGIFQYMSMVDKLDKQSQLADARLEAKLDKNQAVTDTKLEQLTAEVRKHNNFAEKIPVLEEKIRVANNRISDLEKVKL